MRETSSSSSTDGSDRRVAGRRADSRQVRLVARMLILKRALGASAAQAAMLRMGLPAATLEEILSIKFERRLRRRRFDTLGLTPAIGTKNPIGTDASAPGCNGGPG